MQQKKTLGLWMLTALVAGNMIGSGVFLLPANLAAVGSISLFSWIITAIGAFCLAICFSRMSVFVPKNGGPYAYAKAGFGDYIGFQTAFNYWVAVWIGNAAIAIATIAYLTVFFPGLHDPFIGCIAAIALVWILTLVNAIGVREAGFVQLVTTVVKLVPIGLIVIGGWFFFHPSYLSDAFNVTGHSNFHAISQGATLTLWAFIGLESATVPAGSVENPERNIPLATLMGTIIAAVVYIASSTAIMGMIPLPILAKSHSPFAAAAQIMFGSWGAWIIGAGAVIACFGCLNGWILLQAQVGMAAAEDGLFPKIFAKCTKSGVPLIGLLITSFLMSVFLLLTISPDLNDQFQIVILMATVGEVIPYFFTAVSTYIVGRHHPKAKRGFLPKLIIAVGTIYAFFAIFGAGKAIIYYAMMLFFLSVPLYALVRRRKGEDKKLEIS